MELREFSQCGCRRSNGVQVVLSSRRAAASLPGVQGGVASRRGGQPRFLDVEGGLDSPALRGDSLPGVEGSLASRRGGGDSLPGVEGGRAGRL